MKLKHFALCITLLTTGHAIGATTFSIDAGNDGWTGWTESLTSGDGGQNGTFLGSAGSDISTTGTNGTVSWTLYANSGQTASRTYSFGSSLSVGQTVLIDMDNPSIATGGVVGFGLQNSSNVNRFEFYYVGGDPVNSYKINDSGGQENTSPAVPFTFSGLSLAFTLLANDTYSFSINGNPITNSNLNLSASDISQIRIFNFNAGSNENAHFNSLSVIPEPASAALGLIGAVLLLRRRR